jgi:MFS family permease
MSTDEFQQIWKAYDAKLNRSLELNKKLMEELGSQKVRRSFNWVLIGDGCMILCGIAWNAFCGNLAWRFRTEPFFLTAAILSILINSLVICGYVVQVLLLLRINLEKSILGTQKQLAQLEAVIVATYRVSILQAPVYTFFFLNKQMIAGMGPGLWIMQICITGAFIAGVIWLYRNITVKNIEKKWMQTLLKGLGIQSIARARGFIKEIGEYSVES